MTLIPCEFERTTGRPCPVCRSTTHLLEGAPEAAPTHPLHLTLATTLDVGGTRALLAERGLFLFEAEISGLTVAERTALETWAAGQGVLPSAYDSRAHVAGPVVAGGARPCQACTRCRVVLQDHAWVETHGAYPVGARVGLDCDGQPASVEEGGA
jgi:hypothetical protein